MRSNKHHTYHRIPSGFSEYSGSKDELRRYKEEERFEFICSNLDFVGKTVVDIGCNTGFFLTRYLNSGAEKVKAFEGSPICKPVLQKYFANTTESLEINYEYFDFDKQQDEKFGVVILLNVLHHIGDDFGDSALSMTQAKELIISHINNISFFAESLVLQLGFNWKADTNRCLFKKGTKREMVEFISTGTKPYWGIKAIGVPVGTQNSVKYEYLDEYNVERSDELGEFLNRPIFIMESKYFKNDEV